MPTFQNPISDVTRRDSFGTREVGLTHPDFPSFVKLADSGRIEIFAAPGLGIILDPNTNSIVLVGDQVRFMTREEGMHWNKKTFNPKATKYNEPAFVPYDLYGTNGVYADTTDFLEDE